jgi:hypothetical protein
MPRSLIGLDNALDDRGQIGTDDIRFRSQWKQDFTRAGHECGSAAGLHCSQDIPRVGGNEAKAINLHVDLRRHHSIRLGSWFVSPDCIDRKIALEEFGEPGISQLLLKTLLTGISECHQSETRVPQLSKRVRDFLGGGSESIPRISCCLSSPDRDTCLLAATISSAAMARTPRPVRQPGPELKIRDHKYISCPPHHRGRTRAETFMIRKVDVVVIGTGSAASTVAYRCREAGREVAVVDSRPFGGTCALRGCDPKRILVGAGEVIDWNRRMRGKGIRAEQARIDWPELMRFKRSMIERVPQSSQEGFLKNGKSPHFMAVRDSSVPRPFRWATIFSKARIW